MFVTFSPDGARILSGSLFGDTLPMWRGRPRESQPENAWAESAEAHRRSASLWHAREALAAQNRGDGLAAAFHRRFVPAGEGLRLLAWANLAAGDRDGCLLLLKRMHDELQQLQERWELSAALAAVLGSPRLGNAAGPVVVGPLAREELRRRRGVLVRAAALLRDSGIPTADLVALARGVVEEDRQSWQARELLGAALFRDDKAEDALRELDTAVQLHGKGGSLWTRLFLALTHQRLGYPDKAREWRNQSLDADGWEEGVVQRQLLLEFDTVKR